MILRRLIILRVELGDLRHQQVLSLTLVVYSVYSQRIILVTSPVIVSLIQLSNGLHLLLLLVFSLLLVLVLLEDDIVLDCSGG